MNVLFRIVTAFILAVSALFLFTSSVSLGAKAPKCRGIVATHWLSAPGSLIVSDENAVIVGSNGNDYIESKGSNALICAGGGNDQVFVWSPANSYLGSVIYLGSGNDRGTFWYGSTVYGESGDDNSLSVIEDSIAYSGSGSDWIVAERGSSAYGGSGDDTFYSLDAATLSGDSGSDDLHVLGDIEKVNCGSGSDRVIFEFQPHVEPLRCENILD